MLFRSDSYDAALPLSIDDASLAEIDASEIPSKAILLEEREEQSPFSTVTFSIIGAENARLVAQILTVRYGARNMGLGEDRDQPRGDFPAPQEKLPWIRKVEHRMKNLYGLHGVDSMTPLEAFVTEYAAMSIAKAEFVVQLMDGREKYGVISMDQKDREIAAYVNFTFMPEWSA